LLSSFKIQLHLVVLLTNNTQSSPMLMRLALGEVQTLFSGRETTVFEGNGWLIADTIAECRLIFRSSHDQRHFLLASKVCKASELAEHNLIGRRWLSCIWLVQRRMTSPPPCLSAGLTRTLTSSSREIQREGIANKQSQSQGLARILCQPVDLPLKRLISPILVISKLSLCHWEGQIVARHTLDTWSSQVYGGQDSNNPRQSLISISNTRTNTTGWASRRATRH